MPIYWVVWVYAQFFVLFGILTDGKGHCSTLDLTAMLTPPSVAPMDAARQHHLTTKVTKPVFSSNMIRYYCDGLFQKRVFDAESLNC